MRSVDEVIAARDRMRDEINKENQKELSTQDPRLWGIRLMEWYLGGSGPDGWQYILNPRD
jgi:hypothetical protein